MGTRSLIGARMGHEYKIAQYSQFDGYPGGQGLKVLRILKECDSKSLKQAISECQLITENEVNQQLLCGYTPQEFNRETGANIFLLVLFDDVRKVVDSSSFLNDSLFCEYGWVVDYDENMFVCYTGGNHVHTKFPLDDLPTEEAFLKAFEEEEGI